MQYKGRYTISQDAMTCCLIGRVCYETRTVHAGEMGEVAALDLGCSTGATTFELAHCFHVVVGVDQAQHFINAAKVGAAVDRGLPPETIMLDVTQPSFHVFGSAGGLRCGRLSLNQQP